LEVIKDYKKRVLCPHCHYGIQRGEWEDYQGTYQCQSCGNVFYLKVSSDIVQEVRPLTIHLSIPENVPKEISEDFYEGQNCFNVDAFKASIFMCRRSLENLTGLNEADGSNLISKIENLYHKGLVDKASLLAASGIRQFNDYGSHPHNDLLRNVSELEAEMVVKMTWQLIKETYEETRK